MIWDFHYIASEMPFKEMKFKEKKVFVEVDEHGDILLDGHRARMKYRLDDEMVYRPNLRNLEALDGSGRDTPVSSARLESSDRALQKPRADKKKVETNAGRIIAHTDGACLGNPGPSGLGYLIVFPDGRRVEKGEPLGNGTNNIAELTAILRVLEHVEDKEAPLTIHSDSSYSLGVLTKGWKAKANQALIANIKEALGRFSKVTFKKVKGHAGIPENERVDELARTAAELQKTV
jgi:ribonuclease HI